MAGKPKLEVLDALRGFCALIVVILHFSENYIPGFGFRLMPHGCLPVEYFFALTGFTLVYAYDARWSEGMTFGSFFRREDGELHDVLLLRYFIVEVCRLPGSPYLAVYRAILAQSSIVFL